MLVYKRFYGGVQRKVLMNMPMYVMEHTLNDKAAHLKFREATLADRNEVVGMRRNVYRGLDYLPDYYDHFVRDPNRRCIIGEIDGKVVCFGVMYIIDNGESVLSQAGRVREEFERQGNFKRLTEYCRCIAETFGCVRRVALVETTLNEYARSERFRKTHKEITSKLHYAGIITDGARDLIGEASLNITDKLYHIDEQTMALYFADLKIRIYLFPSNRLLLDYVPFRVMKENLSLLKGRNVSFFSDVKQCGDDVTGLLSAGSNYRCMNPSRSYTIDIFGSDEQSLEKHLVFHMRRAMDMSKEPTCLQIFINKGFIAQELCRVLRKYGVMKCDWYVEGGITIKSIVEEDMSSRRH